MKKQATVLDDGNARDPRVHLGVLACLLDADLGALVVKHLNARSRCAPASVHSLLRGFRFRRRASWPAASSSTAGDGAAVTCEPIVPVCMLTTHVLGGSDDLGLHEAGLATLGQLLAQRPAPCAGMGRLQSWRRVRLVHRRHGR